MLVQFPNSVQGIGDIPSKTADAFTKDNTLLIYGYSSCTLVSYISVKGCSAHIHFQNVSLRESRPLNGSNRNA